MTEIQTGAIHPIECYREAWALVKKRFWLLFAVGLIGGLIGGFSGYILIGAMSCGIFYCFLKAVDGEDFKFEDLFKGFDFWLPGLIVGALIFIPVLILYGIIYFPPLAALSNNPDITYDELWRVVTVSLTIDAFFSVFMVCLHTLLMFSFPLLVDRKLSAIEAIKVSAKAVWMNLSGVAGLFGVGFIVSLIGLFGLCVGIFFYVTFDNWREHGRLPEDFSFAELNVK